jgi:FG-GAP repeat
VGNVYVVPGTADLSKWNQSIGAIPGVQTLASGADAGDQFGYALAVGDFNGDGIDDLAVGAPLFNNGLGLVDLYFGSSSGLPAVPSVVITGNTGNQGSGNRNFGSMVAAVGPLGGVGVALMIGAPFDGTSGTSYLFLGRTAANWTTITSYTQASTTFTSAANDGLGFRFGAVPLGDIDNDGVQDFTVPASPASSLYLVGGGSLQAGSQSLVAAGGSLGVLTEDPNCSLGGATYGACFGGTALGNVPLAPGGASLLVAESALNKLFIFDFSPSNLNPTPIVIAPPTIVGTPAYLGWSMVQSDINGDGHPDLLLGTQDNLAPTGLFYFINSGTSPYFAQSPSANLLQPLASYFGFAVAAGSFNGGPPDVAGSDPFGQNDVWVYY